MASPAQTIEGIVLGRVETGENHLRFSVFCESEGFASGSLAKEEGNHLPLRIFFDQVELVLEKAQTTGLPFVRESRVLAKRRRVGPSARSISGSLRSSLAVSEQRSSPSRATASFQFAGNCSL